MSVFVVIQYHRHPERKQGYEPLCPQLEKSKTCKRGILFNPNEKLTNSLDFRKVYIDPEENFSKVKPKNELKIVYKFTRDE